MLYKQGQLLILEQGEYSDFGYDGPFRVLRDIEVQAVVEEFKAAKGRAFAKGPSAFIAWLARAGYIEDAECAKWHLGDGYGASFAPDDYKVTAEDKATAAAETIVRNQRLRDAIKPKARKKITYSGPGYLDPV